MTRFRKLFSFLGLERGLVYVSIGNLISTGLGAILWFILASQMQAHDYGSLNYFIAIVSILTSVGILGFDSTLTTFLAKGIRAMVPEAGTLVLLFSAVIAIILFLIFHSISVSLLLLVMIFFTFSTAEILGNQSYKEFMVVMIVQRVLTLILVPLLFHFQGIEGAILGFAFSHLPVCYRFFLAMRQFRMFISTIQPIKKFFLHSYMLGISKTLPYFSDKIIIVPLFGTAVAGYYQFGIQMLTVTSIIPVILYSYLLPRQAGGGDISSSKKTGILGIVTCSVIILFLVILMPTIVNNLFPSFKNAIYSSQIILLAGLPFTIVAIINSMLLAKERSIHVAIAAGLFLVTQYTLIITVGTYFGLLGLSISTVIAAIVQAMYLYLKSRIHL
jgi:O-antigen/teichoic acid export membrane protein